MPCFHQALLLFNPASGSHLEYRAATVKRIADILRRAGVTAEIEPTRAPGTAGVQAREAIARGCEAILACGGDGTVFDTLQGVAETSAILGVIPLGTGNVLAHDLGLAARAERAAAQLLDFVPQRISLGKIRTVQRTRYFTVAAGVGVHAELLYRANARIKQRGGYLAYYTHGLRLLFRRPFVEFPVEITAESGETIATTALELVAMRVRSLGGPLRLWRPGSSLLEPDLRLILLRTPRRAAILRYAAQALTGVAPLGGLERTRDFSFVSARTVRCLAPIGHTHAMRVQADGELLGTSPAEISIVPQALSLLVSPNWPQRQ